MEPDSHVVPLDLKQARELFDRQPLDVTQQEQACVLAVQDAEGTPKPLLQQARRLDGGVRRLMVVNRFRTKLTAAQHVDGRVDGGAPKVGGRQRNLLDASTGQDAQKDGLQDASASAGFR